MITLARVMCFCFEGLLRRIGFKPRCSQTAMMTFSMSRCCDSALIFSHNLHLTVLKQRTQNHYSLRIRSSFEKCSLDFRKLWSSNPTSCRANKSSPDQIGLLPMAMPFQQMNIRPFCKRFFLMKKRQYKKRSIMPVLLEFAHNHTHGRTSEISKSLHIPYNASADWIEMYVSNKFKKVWSSSQKE